MSKRSLALFATIIGSGVVFLDSTVVNLALPNIKANLGASFSDLQWIVDGYLLTLSALILIGGSLGDILGRKRMYLLGLGGFGLMSLLCGLAPNTTLLILFRFLQGIFGALLIPGGLAIINTNFPKEERGRAIGRWAAWSGITVAIGPLLGGYLIGIGNWRWIFFINIPLIIACGILAKIGIVESRDRRVRKIDVPGAALAAIALGGITYGLIEGPINRWQAGSLIPLAIGVFFSAVFLWFESRSKDPMVHLDLFKSRNFSGANLMTLAMYGALSGFMFSLVIYLQTRLGYSAIKAGASLLPVSLLLLFFSSRVGALASKVGPRYFLTAGPVIAAIGMITLLNYKPGGSYLTVLLPRVILFGIGLCIFVAPLTATVMASVHEQSSGIASAINNAVSRIGGLVVIAVLGVLGAEHLFRFGVVLSSSLALVAGIISFLTIRNHPKKVR